MSEIEVFQNPATIVKHSDDSFNAIAKAGDFFLRVQLFGSNSNIVKQGKFPLAHYGLVRTKENIDDLGAQFDCVPLSWRPKAMRIDGDEVLSYFDNNDPEFQKIMADSEVADSGCMYGPEFLIWLPVQKEWATLFYSNPTMRREAPNMKALLQKPATMKVKYIETKKYSWHGPVVTSCSTPLANVPTKEDLDKQLEKFNNPPTNEVVKETAANGRER